MAEDPKASTRRPLFASLRYVRRTRQRLGVPRPATNSRTRSKPRPRETILGPSQTVRVSELSVTRGPGPLGRQSRPVSSSPRALLVAGVGCLRGRAETAPNALQACGGGAREVAPARPPRILGHVSASAIWRSPKHKDARAGAGGGGGLRTTSPALRPLTKEDMMPFRCPRRARPDA